MLGHKSIYYYSSDSHMHTPFDIIAASTSAQKEAQCLVLLLLRVSKVKQEFACSMNALRAIKFGRKIVMIFIVLQPNGPLTYHLMHTCLPASSSWPPPAPPDTSSVPRLILLFFFFPSRCDWHAHLRLNDSISPDRWRFIGKTIFGFLEAVERRKNEQRKNQSRKIFSTASGRKAMRLEFRR